MDWYKDNVNIGILWGWYRIFILLKCVLMQIPSYEWNRSTIIFIGIICFVYLVVLGGSPLYYDHQLTHCTKITHPENLNLSSSDFFPGLYQNISRVIESSATLCGSL